MRYRRINTPTLNLVKKWEGEHKINRKTGRVHPYLCPALVWTQGMGTTINPDNKKPITKYSPPITRQKSAEWLRSDMESKYGRAVSRYLKTDLSDDSFGALTSLCYNIGSGALKRSTVMRRINEQDWDNVPRAWRMWRMGGGRVLKGLQRRREDEIVFFKNGMTSNKNRSSKNTIDRKTLPTNKRMTLFSRITNWLGSLWQKSTKKR